MNENLVLYDKVRAVPQSAQKQIKGGRLSGMTDINPMWRIKTLTEHFGICGIGWYYTVTNKWLETVGSEIVAFVDVELYINNNGKWSMPILGTGGSKLATKEKSGVFVSDECYKMATTDAISVACKQLGIGADIYYQKDKTKYSADEPKKITAEHLMDIEKEIDRTGVDPKKVCRMYMADSLKDMTDKDYFDAIAKLEKHPDRPKPTPKDANIANPDAMPKELPFR